MNMIIVSGCDKSLSCIYKFVGALLFSGYNIDLFMGLCLPVRDINTSARVSA